MKKLPVVYVAGPYRGPSEYAVEQNIQRASAAALRIWRMGAVALCPHMNTAHFGGAAGEPEPWLAGDLELLSRCNALFAINGWQESEGAVGEVKYAEEHHIPVFYTWMSLGEWVSGWFLWQGIMDRVMDGMRSIGGAS